MDDVIKIDAANMEWEASFIEPAQKNLYRKILIEDPDTGASVRVLKYPAGFINPQHTHHCAHGMYVLKGTLHTSEGDYTAGSFVWFPEGKTMWHGATENEDVEMLFITNKKFDIHYL